jgi:hypothetical protein
VVRVLNRERVVVRERERNYRDRDRDYRDRSRPRRDRYDDRDDDRDSLYHRQFRHRSPSRERAWGDRDRDRYRDDREDRDRALHENVRVRVPAQIWFGWGRESAVTGGRDCLIASQRARVPPLLGVGLGVRGG